ncbi:MAG: hypothetical protein FJW18_01590 [Actinobacteria bacterium]|nr:hypothetical protein [Actinomycetota bacterium]
MKEGPAFDLVDTIMSTLAEMAPLDDEFSSRTHLLSSGVMDSMSVLEFVERLENLLGVHIPDELLVEDSFASAERLAEVLRALL